MIRFETEPGEQAQVDWTVIRRGRDKLSVFMEVLVYSRFSFVRFAGDEKFETMLNDLLCAKISKIAICCVQPLCAPL